MGLRCQWPGLVTHLGLLGANLLVAPGIRPRPVEHPARDRRQPRAVYKCWTRMRIFYGPLFLAVTCSAEEYKNSGFSARRLRMLPYSSHCLVRSGYMYCVSYGSVLTLFLRPLVSDSHLFVALPEEYMIWIFWEMTSGIISVCSALGSTVDTCFCQSTRLWGVSRIFYVNVNSDLEGTSWLSLSTETGLHSANCAADREDLTGTVLGLVDTPIDVQRQVPWFREYRRGDSAVAVRSCVSSTRSSLSKVALLHFAAFFALRPHGRECPFFSPR